jgi:hypothetical protein
MWLRVALLIVAYSSMPLQFDVITIGGLTSYTGYFFYRATHYVCFIAKEAYIRWDIV